MEGELLIFGGGGGRGRTRSICPELGDTGGQGQSEAGGLFRGNQRAESGLSRAVGSDFPVLFSHLKTIILPTCSECHPTPPEPLRQQQLAILMDRFVLRAVFPR